MSETPGPGRIHPLVQRFADLLEAPGFGRRLMLAIAAAAIAVAGADVVHRRTALASWEGAWGFYALFGFFAFTFVVLMGWPLRRLLSRPEDYYREDEDA